MAYGLTGLMRACRSMPLRGRVDLPADALRRHGISPDRAACRRDERGLRRAARRDARESQGRLARQACPRSQRFRPRRATAFLPLALVDPYLAALRKQRDPFREIAEINPLYRLWRLAHLSVSRSGMRKAAQMAKQNRRWSWRSWLPDVGAAFSRFPLAVILAALLTLYKLSTDSPGDIDRKIMGALAASFLWVVAVDLYLGIAWRLARGARPRLARRHRRDRALVQLPMGGLACGSASARRA